MLTVRARRLAARSATPKCIASSRRLACAIDSTLARPRAVSMRISMPMGVGCDGVFEVGEDVVRLARERLGEHRRLRAGHGELAPLQPGLDRLVTREAHALTVARGVAGLPLPGCCWASGEGTAARAASGAAVLR